jgi:hypothetical protein
MSARSGAARTTRAAPPTPASRGHVESTDDRVRVRLIGGGAAGPAHWRPGEATHGCRATPRSAASGRLGGQVRRDRLGTTSERADRSRAEGCFAQAEQSPEEAGLAQLVLVRREAPGSRSDTLASRLEAGARASAPRTAERPHFRGPLGTGAEGPWRSRMFVLHDRRWARRSASVRTASSEFATVRSQERATTAPHQAPSAHRSVPSSPRYSNAVPVVLGRSS